MEKLIPTLLTIAVVVVLFGLLALGWRARRRRQAAFPAPASPPERLAGIRHHEDLLYVATTIADHPYERVAVAGLGFRGRAEMTVADEGVALDIAGSAPVLIPADAIDGVGRATWTIDRVVDADGLLFLRWRLGDTAIDSYLRSTDPDRLLAALAPIVPTTPGRTAA